jgi:Domain of unknown function (DUF4276)
MILRGLLLTDGPSDTPLADHLARLCSARGRQVRITTPDLRLLSRRVGLTVEDRLRTILQLDSNYDIVFVHRDSEGQNPQLRRQEIADAFTAVRCALPAVPIVPIRMTEAWLLIDEQAIREVAGRPTGRVDLNLPPVNRVEEVPDAKRLLAEILVRASQLRGRKLERFKQRFGDHRRQLLERLDHCGQITALSAWQDLLVAVDAALATLPPDANEDGNPAVRV